MSLKTRIIPVLLWNEHGSVKGRQFNSDRYIGSIVDRVRLMERRDIDELIILDVAATPNKRGPRFEEISGLCDNLFMAVTIGGGIRNVADIKRLLASGADKVAIGTAALERPDLIAEASEKFGAQAVVVSIDYRGNEVFTGAQRMVPTGRHPIDTAISAERYGAGEILLTSIEHDGMMQGYDLDLIGAVAAAVDIPVVAAGGCGSYEHLAEVLYNTNAHAVAVGAAFQFMDLTPKGASRYLHEKGFQVRL